MITTVHLTRPITNLPTEEQDPWWTWCHRMGIDPDKVLIHLIELDDQARTIGYTHHDGHDQHHWQLVQLEAPALTPPPGYLVTTCACTTAGDRDHRECSA